MIGSKSNMYINQCIILNSNYQISNGKSLLYKDIPFIAVDLPDTFTVTLSKVYCMHYATIHFSLSCYDTCYDTR